MTDTQRPWDRLPTETPKSYAAFRAYCEMGAKRSVREAARQHHVKTASSGPEVTTVKPWLGRLVGAGPDQDSAAHRDAIY